MEYKTFEMEWKKFSSQVIPIDSSPGQVREMKLAFHSGALCIMNFNLQVGDCDSEDKAFALMEFRKKELDEYFDELLAAIDK